MENPTHGTSPNLLECIQSIPCTMGVTRLREVTRENLDFLIGRYPQHDFPLLHKELQELVAFSAQFDTTESVEGKIFWMLHVYLCFFSNPTNPLIPQDGGRRKILGHLKNLKSSVQ